MKDQVDLGESDIDFLAPLNSHNIPPLYKHFFRLLAFAVIGIASPLSQAIEHVFDTGNSLPSASITKRIILVGPVQKHTKPSDAARIARDGDTIEITAGIYRGDVVAWRANNLTIKGVGGLVTLVAEGKSVEGKAIWVIKGNNTRIENIEFVGARVRDKNGAGIRQEGAGLVVSNCIFRDNEEGILTGPNSASDILIENSEFSHNGHSGGKSHNIYIGRIRSFTLRNSYIHHAYIGSNVKSRANINRIVNNRIMDEHDGRGNYSIDLSNGGIAYIAGNLIHQSPYTENYHMIAFGPEGLAYPDNQLSVINNTMVNDRSDGRFIWNRSNTPAKIFNNIFAGAGKAVRGNAIFRGNVLAPPSTWKNRLKYRFTGKHPALKGLSLATNNHIVDDIKFRNRLHFDYRLLADSPAIDSAVEVVDNEGKSLIPIFEYEYPHKAVPRPLRGAVDSGAYEYKGR